MAGSTTTIGGGEASIRLNTAGLTPGTYRLFARAQDNRARWSPAVSTTLTVLPADDHGDNAATAAAVGSPSSTSGTIEVKGDVDWFKFQAVAGKTYTFTMQLGTLRDTVLSLYDVNGAARLAFNDDYGSTSASQITWKAPASGTYFLAVGAYGNSLTGSYVLDVVCQSLNSAPVLAAIGDRVMPLSQGTLRLTVTASDPDGDPLRYSAKILTADSMTAYSGSSVTASMAGNVLTVNRLASYTKDFCVQVTVSDGKSTAFQTFRVSPSATPSARSAALTSAISAVAGDSPELPGTSPTAPMTSSIDAAAWMVWESHGLPSSALSSVFDTLAATLPLTGAPSSLRDDVFGRLVSSDESPVASDRPLAALDYEYGCLLAGDPTDTWLTRASGASPAAGRPDAGGEWSTAGEETIAADLGPRCSVERRAIDEIFDLLAGL